MTKEEGWKEGFMWVDIPKREEEEEEGSKENKGGDELLFPLPLNGLTGRRKKMTRERTEREKEREKMKRR